MSIREFHGIVISEIENYLAYNNTSPELAFSLQNLKDKIVKKLITVDKKLEEASFSVFSEYNLRGRSWVIDPSSTHYPSVVVQSVIDHVALRVEQALRPLERSEDEWLLAIARRGDFGTGSSVKTEQNYLYKTLAGKLTYSDPRTLVAYKAMCRDNIVMRAPEKERQYNYGCMNTPFGTCTFVPKDTTKYRMVVTEPSLDMFFQRGFASFFDDALKSLFNIELPTQERINRQLARVGSITGRLATIDSTSASDSIYLEPLTSIGVIPQWANEVISAIKSKYVTYGSRKMKLSMVGTQGCGFTFSFMTFLLASIVEGCYVIKGIDARNGSNFAVYGDDVICRSECYDLITTVMQVFGFVPNLAKSYHTGPFRESCGGDYYKGHQVRAVYIKKLDTKQDHCVAFNRLIEWSAENGVVLYDSMKFLADRVGLSHAVPAHSNYDAGLHQYGLIGRYQKWDPKSHSLPMPDCHYDGRVQMAIKGHIIGKRIPNRRKDGDSVKYTVKKSWCNTLGVPTRWYRDSTLDINKYIQISQRIWMYLTL